MQLAFRQRRTARGLVPWLGRGFAGIVHPRSIDVWRGTASRLSPGLGCGSRSISLPFHQLDVIVLALELVVDLGVGSRR